MPCLPSLYSISAAAAAAAAVQGAAADATIVAHIPLCMIIAQHPKPPSSSGNSS
jgi:hypothetical protein